MAAGPVAMAPASLASRIVAWRRDFHAHPELGFEEERTAGIVTSYLKGLGFEVMTGVGGTGVMGYCGARPAATRCSRASTWMRSRCRRPRVLSSRLARSAGCTLVGTTVTSRSGWGSRRCSPERRSELQRHVKLVFQPAEERLGGARAVLADGVLHDPEVSACLSLHLWNDIPTGCVAIDEGPVFAASIG